MTTENTFRFITIVLFFIAINISIHYRKKANDTGKDEITFEQEGKWISFLRSTFALAGYLGMMTYMIYPPAMAWAQIDLPDTARWVGIGIMAAMLPLLYWMFSNLGNNITPTVVTREEHQLVSTGPYRYIRHPLYTFGGLNFLGLSLASANLFIFISYALGMYILSLRTPIEEAHLVEKFGDQYRTYMKNTGRYLPKLKPTR